MCVQCLLYCVGLKLLLEVGGVTAANRQQCIEMMKESNKLLAIAPGESVLKSANEIHVWGM